MLSNHTRELLTALKVLAELEFGEQDTDAIWPRLLDRLERSLIKDAAPVEAEPAPRWHRQIDGTEPYGKPNRLTGPPPVGRRVTYSGQTFRRVDVPPSWDDRATGNGLTYFVTEPPLATAYFTWDELIATYGHGLTLVPLTKAEEASEELYGPIGARWGNPDVPCPYPECVLGIRHARQHLDINGDPLGQTAPPAPDEPSVRVAASLAEATASPCICGHPEQHQPGCPRYDRLRGPDSHEPADATG